MSTAGTPADAQDDRTTPGPVAPETMVVTDAPPNPAPEAGMHLEPAELTAVIHRLRRAQGQIGGVLRMLEEGADCADVVTQLSAASKALDRAGFAIIASGLEQCITRGEDAAGIDRAKLQKLFLSLA